jgi:hypothetical protein
MVERPKQKDSESLYCRTEAQSRASGSNDECYSIDVTAESDKIHRVAG